MRLHPWAIFWGGIADIGLTWLIGIPVMIAFLLTHTISASQIADAGHSALPHTPASIVLFIIGSFASIFGGYVAARLAKSSETINGAASAWLCMLFGLIGALWGHASLQTLVAEIASPILGACGGYLAYFQRAKRSFGIPN